MRSRRILRAAAFAAVAYTVGSIQVPRIIQRLISDEPPTNHLTLEWGEGKAMRFDFAGATTVEVTAGPAWGILASLLDMAKVALPAAVLRRTHRGQHLDILWASVSSVGQMLPLQHRFAGGRGDSVTMGMCLARDPLAIPVSIASSQLVGLYILRDPLLAAESWTAFLPLYFALRRKPDLVVYTLVVNAVRWSASLRELRQVNYYRRAGEYETREFHEAFERTHFGYIHKWLRERGLIRYAYMDEVESDHCTTPVKPSTRTIDPSGIRVAPETLTTQGMPSSRATMEECESRPPDSATMPPARASIGVQPTSE